MIAEKYQFFEDICGRWDAAKGQVKETVGELINNPNLEAEGIIEKAESS